LANTFVFSRFLPGICGWAPCGVSEVHTSSVGRVHLQSKLLINLTLPWEICGGRQLCRYKGRVKPHCHGPFVHKQAGLGHMPQSSQYVALFMQRLFEVQTVLTAHTRLPLVANSVCRAGFPAGIQLIQLLVNGHF
jgi:hypothetical protein